MTGSARFTNKQESVFNRFLLDGTANTLSALETVFELNIDCSDSTIEIGPAGQNENLKHIGAGPLYIVSSALAGEVNGSIVLFIRSADFKHLGNMLRPVLSPSLLANPDADLTVLGDQKPDWLHKDDGVRANGETYNRQMMDVLAEIGNVLIGLYSKSIFKICGLNTQHTVPLVMKDPHQTMVRRILFSSGEKAKSHIVIENEIFLEDKPIKLWCLISPTADSFADILNGGHE